MQILIRDLVNPGSGMEKFGFGIWDKQSRICNTAYWYWYLYVDC